MKREFCCGIIPLLRRELCWRVLLVKHAKGHWSFPKGHREIGEDSLTCALRELKEETDLTVVELLMKRTFSEQYTLFWHEQRVIKTVTYYLAEVSGPLRLQKEELVDSLWLPPAEIKKQISFPEGKQMWEEALVLLKSLL